MEKLAQINRAIMEYFELNGSVSKIPAKDLMPWFIRAGIFEKDEKAGLPIRKILRQLDSRKRLHHIPYVIAERKQKNTNWFFGRATETGTIAQTQGNKTLRLKIKTNKRKDSDEHYVIDLCDEVLGMTGARQHRFDFLLGDAGTKLPVDAFYESLKLVIEFNEQQHTKAVKHFDKPDKLTVSGVHRGDQRKIYDERKRTELPRHDIQVLSVPYSAFECDSRGKLRRDRGKDMEVVKEALRGYLKGRGDLNKLADK